MPCQYDVTYLKRNATLKERDNTERKDATLKERTQQPSFVLLIVANRRHTLTKGHNTERINHKGHNTERRDTTTKETSISSGIVSDIWESIQNVLIPLRMHHQTSWAECRLLSLSILKNKKTKKRIMWETQSLWNRRILVPSDLLPQEARVKWGYIASFLRVERLAIESVSPKQTKTNQTKTTHTHTHTWQEKGAGSSNNTEHVYNIKRALLLFFFFFLLLCACVCRCVCVGLSARDNLTLVCKDKILRLINTLIIY